MSKLGQQGKFEQCDWLNLTRYGYYHKDFYDCTNSPKAFHEVKSTIPTGLARSAAFVKSMKEELQNIDWKVLLNQDSIATNWKLFCNKVHGAMSKHVKIRNIFANKSKQKPLSKSQGELIKLKINYGKITKNK